MREPAQTLVGEVERIVSALPDAVLFPGLGAEGQRRFAAAMGVPPPPGLATFLAAHDGGVLAPDARLLTIDEAAARVTAAPGLAGRLAGARWQVGLWPVAERGGPALRAGRRGGERRRRVAGRRGDRARRRSGRDVVPAFSARAVRRAGGGERRGRCGDRAGRDALPARSGARRSLAGSGGAAGRRRARGRDRRDAGRRAARGDAADAGADARDRDARRRAGSRGACARTPRRRRCARSRTRSRSSRSARATTTRGWTPRRWCSCWRPSAATPSTRRERARAAGRVDLGDGRVLARRGAGGAGRGRRGAPVPPVGALALRIVAMLEPDDRDLPQLQAPTASCAAGCAGCRKARDALEAGQVEAAVRAARAALATPELADAGRGARVPGRGAQRGARSGRGRRRRQRATEINPTLVDGWRELGDAQLEAGALKEAEAAFRRVVAMDTTYGLGYAKLAQVLLEQARTLEALEAIGEAARRGGDPFFIAAIRGDIYAEMERHPEAAEAYDQALAIDPEDHWALHQAALEHGFAGHQGRASELFQAALDHDRDGCHQTLVDYGDHLRRIGPHRRRREAVSARGRRGPRRAGVEADAARGRARAARRAELTAARNPSVGASRETRRRSRATPAQTSSMRPAEARPGTPCRCRAGRSTVMSPPDSRAS